jgi:hypothetical protein
VEFEGWNGVLGTTIICWVGNWLFGLLLAALVRPDLMPSTFYTQLLLSLAAGVIASSVSLLIAWAIVPGARIKNVFGLVVAAILIVVFNYGAHMLIAGTALGWL